jgi:hypothetical protein
MNTAIDFFADLGGWSDGALDADMGGRQAVTH